MLICSHCGHNTKKVLVFFYNTMKSCLSKSALLKKIQRLKMLDVGHIFLILLDSFNKLA